GPMSFQNRLPLPTFYPKREHDILKSSNLAGKPIRQHRAPHKNPEAETHPCLQFGELSHSSRANLPYRPAQVNRATPIINLTPMVKILSVASSDILKTTRQLLLEKEGFAVRSALNLSDVEALGETEKVDLALIGHGFRGPEKRKLARAVNHLSPGLPIP